jgi:hypothetical protein
MMAEMKELSTSKELEELGNKKAVLEAESHSLKEEQQTLEERIRVLEEKIAIEELRNGNKTKREAVSRLKLKMDELEQRLEQVGKAPETEPTTEAGPEIAEPPEPKEEASVGITGAAVEEPEEDVVTVAPLESPMRTEVEKGSEDIKKQQEKKRKKFF